MKSHSTRSLTFDGIGVRLSFNPRTAISGSKPFADYHLGSSFPSDSYLHSYSSISKDDTAISSMDDVALNAGFSAFEHAICAVMPAPVLYEIYIYLVKINVK